MDPDPDPEMDPDPNYSKSYEVIAMKFMEGSGVVKGASD